HVPVALLVAGVKACGVDFDSNSRIGDRVGDVDYAMSDGEGAPQRREPEHMAALEGYVRLLGVDSIPASLRDLQDAVSRVRRGHLSVLSFAMQHGHGWKITSRLKLLAALDAFRLSICFAAAKAMIGYTCRSSISSAVARSWAIACVPAAGPRTEPEVCQFRALRNRGRTLRATVCRYPAVQSCRCQSP